jgi:hypothetical protein
MKDLKHGSTFDNLKKKQTFVNQRSRGRRYESAREADGNAVEKAVKES